MMAQTSGGKAAAVLCLALVELYGQDETGMILDELSALLLPQEKRIASMRQLGEVASILGNKLAGVGFGSHLASHLTRIRQAYFTARLDIPKRLLDAPDHAAIIEFLHCMSKALVEEHCVVLGRFHGRWLPTVNCDGFLSGRYDGSCRERDHLSGTPSISDDVHPLWSNRYFVLDRIHTLQRRGHREIASRRNRILSQFDLNGRADSQMPSKFWPSPPLAIPKLHQACVNDIARVLSDNGQLPRADRNISR